MQNKDLLTTAVVVISVSIAAFVYAAPQGGANAAPAPHKAAEKPGKPDDKSRSGAAAQKTSDLAFVGTGPTVVTVDPKVDSDTSVGLSVQNKSETKPYHPEAKLGDMGIVSESGSVIPTTAVLGVDGVPKTLEAGDTAHLVLNWKKDTKARPGTYDGFLILLVDHKEVARREIQVVISDTGGAIQPLVSKLNIRLYRQFPLVGNFCIPGPFSPEVPLQTPVDAGRAGLTRRPLLAVTIRDLAGTALVYWDGKADDLKADRPHLGVRVGSIPFAGKYEGTWNYAGDKTVAVTLNATDLIVWPFACLCLGVWVAIQGKNYLNGGRQLLVWKARLAAARDALKQAQAEFLKMVSGVAAHYSIQEDFVAQGQVISDDINLLRGNLVGSLDPSNKLYQFVDAQIPALEAVPKSWVLFAKQLAALSEARTNFPAVDPPPGFDPQPGVVHQADSLLTGKDLLIKDLAGLQDQVVAETGFLTQWNRLWTRATGVQSGLGSFIATHGDYVKAHSDKVDALRKLVADALAELWELSGLDPDKNKTASVDLDALSTSYSELLTDAEQKLLQVESLRTRLVLDFTGPGSDAPEDTRKPITTDWKSGSSQQDFQAQIDQRDRALGILSYILAVLTGLSQNYFGQNFGTVADYVKLILWAFGAKIAVDALSGGLERWIGSQSS